MIVLIHPKGCMVVVLGRLAVMGCRRRGIPPGAGVLILTAPNVRAGGESELVMDTTYASSRSRYLCAMRYGAE
jgi:hypothetical protein